MSSNCNSIRSNSSVKAVFPLRLSACTLKPECATGRHRTVATCCATLGLKLFPLCYKDTESGCYAFMNISRLPMEDMITLTEQEQIEVKTLFEILEECLGFLESDDYESIVRITRIKTIALLTDWRRLHAAGNLGVLAHTFSFLDISVDEDVALLGALDQVNTLWGAWQRERILTIKGKFLAVLRRLRTVCDRIMRILSVSPIPTRTYVDNEGTCRAVVDMKRVPSQGTAPVQASEDHLPDDSLRSILGSEMVFCPAAKKNT